VEDEDSVRDLVRRLLTRAGYRVITAAGPTEALERFDERGGEVDLLLSDVIMPGMSGGELARILKERRPELKTLFMSGYTDDAVLGRGSLEEEASFIQKPFSLSSLEAKVRETLVA